MTVNEVIEALAAMVAYNESIGDFEFVHLNTYEAELDNVVKVEVDREASSVIAYTE